MKQFLVTVMCEFLVDAEDEDEALDKACSGSEDENFFWDSANVEEIDNDKEDDEDE